jgi:hypothetical protein
MTKWTDVTGYSQDDPSPRTPMSWETTCNWLRIVVTRHRDFDPDVWVLHAHGIGIVAFRLSSRGLPDAKREALSLVRMKLAQALAAIQPRGKIRGSAK